MKIKAFYSDPHYGHENIISFCSRPFWDVEHMERSFVEKYNKIITDIDDVCIWVGDSFFCRKEEAKKIMSKLNGKKILIKGNHDMKESDMLYVGFDIVCEKMFIKIDGHKCLICHYPWKTLNEDINDRYKDKRPEKDGHTILIHGHTHSSKKFDDLSVHVGVDAWNYEPAPYEEVEKIVKSLKEKIR